MYKEKILENGFAYIEIQNESMIAKIALQGAHIFEYKREDGETPLWLSGESAFEKGVAIRGGIPICWPRFGSQDTTMPQHGFARVEMFRLVEVKELDAKTTLLTLRLNDTEATRSIWNYKFELDVVFTLSEGLKIELITKNRDTREFMLTQALHTYFSISDIGAIKIEGLENKTFLDALTNTNDKEEAAITFDREIDRVYQGADKEIKLLDRDRIIKLHTSGSASAVVWNPWIEKCSRMSFMHPLAYKEFVCIESANAFNDFKVIKSQKNYTLSLTVSF